MEIEQLQSWGPILSEMQHDQALAAEALAANEWFTPQMMQAAIGAMLPWWAPGSLADLRGRYPAVQQPRRIGLILAGNLPLVGLHDLLMVLLSGHEAVLKPSHKDRALLLHLLAHSPAELQARVRIVEQLLPADIDFLIATGSNVTAQQIAASFIDLPQLIRKNRFSIGILKGDESPQELDGLALDVLLYHGLGCRSVSSLLVPRGYDLQALADALARMDEGMFAPCWADVLRYARATQQVLGQQAQACPHIVFAQGASLRPARIGMLNVVEYGSTDELARLLAEVRDDLQCIVGEGHVPFGQAQFPALDDFADGADTLAVLTKGMNNE